jgi:hypothetical protein
MAKSYKVVVGDGEALTKRLVDDGSGVEIKFTYRLPTNQEKIKYNRESAKAQGKKVVIKTRAAARRAVLPLIEGFRFPRKDIKTRIHIEIGGKLEALSCQKGDPGYVPEWRNILTQTVPGMLETLGMSIFAGVSDDAVGIVFEDDGEYDDGEYDDGEYDDGEKAEDDIKILSADSAKEEEAPN